jgi:hypothetical protein
MNPIISKTPINLIEVSNSKDAESQPMSYFKNKPSSSSIVLDDKNDIESVKLYAYAVCREYLSGAWKSIDIEDFRIERIT